MVNRKIKVGVEELTVLTSVSESYPDSNGVYIASGIMGFFLRETDARKALIAALIEADRELDAAAEKRKETAA